MGDPKHIVAAAGMFEDSQGRILLVQTPLRGWECPGGQVEQGEDLITALAREALEESGCTVSVDQLVGVYSNVRAPEKVIFMFRGRYLSGEPRADHETTGAGLFPPAEALALVTSPFNRMRLEDALSRADRPVYRVYRTRPYEEVSVRLL